MIPLALAVAAGSLAARFFPALSGAAPAGAGAFAAALAWFMLRRGRESAPFDAGTTPPEYLPHILPSPGFIARRGRNIFLVIVCFGCFFLAAWRQGAWRERLGAGRPPPGLWVSAVLVADAPNVIPARAGGAWRVPARVISINGERAADIPVRLHGTAKEPFRRGDFVAARVRFSPPRAPGFPGAFDGAFWLERDGLAASAFAAPGRRGGEGVHGVIPVDDPPLFTRLRRAVDAVRAAAIGKTLARGGRHGPMLAAMLYGYRDELPDELNDAFRRAGIGHVLAISGLHVGLVIGLLWWLGGWLPWSIRGRSLACLAVAVIYLGLSGGQVAAARATLMAVIHLGALAAGRRGDMMNSLGAAAFFIILGNPTAPLDVSFQLSFTAVVFIHIAIGGRRDAENAGRPAPDALLLGRRLRAQFDSLARLSLATWVGLYPIVAAVFHQVNLVGLPINIVVIPMMGAVLAGGLLLPVLGWIPGAEFVLALPSAALARIALGADALPYSSFPVHSPGGWWMAVFYIFVFLYLLNRMIADPARRRRWLRLCAAGIVLGLAGTTAGMASLPPPAEGRLALLPGSGLGVVAAETPDGAIALVGSLRRQGLDESGWLHSLRRRGAVSVVALGGGRRDALAGLAFHYPFASRENLPLISKRLADAAPAWTPVPAAPGIEYALVRNGRGRASALVVRTGGRMIATASRLGARDAKALAAFLRENGGKGQTVLLCLGPADRELLLKPERWRADRVVVRGGPGAPLPEGWLSQEGAGAFLLDGGLRAYDGAQWRSINAQ